MNIFFEKAMCSFIHAQLQSLHKIHTSKEVLSSKIAHVWKGIFYLWNSRAFFLKYSVFKDYIFWLCAYIHLNTKWAALQLNTMCVKIFFYMWVSRISIFTDLRKSFLTFTAKTHVSWWLLKLDLSTQVVTIGFWTTRAMFARRWESR